MKAKRKGNRNEHRSMALLKSMGYQCVRSAASLGPFDVVGISADGIALVQCKSNRWPSEVELGAIRQFRCPANARKLIHRWRDRQRLPDIRQVKSPHRDRKERL